MVKKVEISERTGKPKIIRQHRGREEAKAQATMTEDAWATFQTEKYAKQWPKPDYMAEKREVQYVRDGGEGAYRNKTYEIVTRWQAETKIAYRPHAKKPGSKSHVRYEKYAKAKTVGEALKRSSWPMDWCYDYEHGFIKVSGPVRDEPIDMSKVEDTSTLTDVDTAVMNWFRRELAKRYDLNIKDLFVERGGGETMIMRAHRHVADRKSEKMLKAAAEAKRCVSDEEVATAMSTWAFAHNPNRQNVLPEGQKWVWSDTLGLIRDRLGDIHITDATSRYPAFTKLITQWLYDRIPPEVRTFTFTSLNLNSNYAAKRHRDGNNFGPSMIKAFGQFTGGQLTVFPEDDRAYDDMDTLPAHKGVKVDLVTNLAMWNGNSAHEVDDFEGNRYSVVYFTAGCHAKAKEEDKRKLVELGFPYPAADENPHAHLARPKGYGTKRPVAKDNLKSSAAEKVAQTLPTLRTWNATALAKNSKRHGWAAVKGSKRTKSPAGGA